MECTFQPMEYKTYIAVSGLLIVFLKKMILCIRKQKIIFDRDSNKKEISFDLFVRIVYICGNPMPVIPLMEGSGWDTYT